MTPTRALILLLLLVAACTPAAAPVPLPAPTLLREPAPLQYEAATYRCWSQTRPNPFPALGYCMEVVLDETAANALPNLGALAFGPPPPDAPPQVQNAEGERPPARWVPGSPSPPPMPGLAFTQSILYATRPADGTVIAMTDQDGDGFMDPPRVFAEGLAYPFGLAYHEGALYIAGAGTLYRLRDTDHDGRADERLALVEGLPVGGAWTQGVAVGPGGRLYLVQEDAIRSYAPDGSDPQIVARGPAPLRDFSWHPQTGTLWATGSDALHVLSSEGAEAVLPFAAESAPSGMVFYRGDAFPEMQGHLVVVTAGSWNRAYRTGYEILLVDFAADGAPSGRVSHLVPDVGQGGALWELSEKGLSFYPEHPVDVVMGPEGWLYISAREGLIIRIRPS